MTDPKSKQSLENFESALGNLKEATQKGKLSNLELAGAIQSFEFCYELAWKTLQKHAGSLGRRIVSPREAFQYAFEAGYIQNEKVWLDMIEDRNETVHTYDQTTAKRIFKEVKERYFLAFADLHQKLARIIN